MSDDIDMRDSWNHISPHYQEAHQIPTDFAHYGPHCPNEDDLQLVGDVRGKRVLEIGCGGGQCSIAFAKRGAIVTGIDLSDAQVEYARGLAAKEEVAATFMQGNIEDLSAIPDDSQGVVFSAYALQYVEQPQRCFAEVRRVLAPDGLFVFSLDHPFWQRLASDSMTVVRSYHDRSPQCWNGGAEDGHWLRSFPRTVGDWLRFIRGAGLEVLDLLEPAPVEYGSGLDWGDDCSQERQHMVPATIIWKARRPE